MIYGIGTDVLAFERFAGLNDDWDDPFFRRTFSTAEHTAALKRHNPLHYFAGCFAVKEAVFKAMRANSEVVRLSDIESNRDKYGRPQVTLHNSAATFAATEGIKHIHISLSYESELVIAFALAEI